MLINNHKVWYLRETLGARLVAYILNQDNTLVIRRWTQVECEVEDEINNKIDLCIKLVYILIEKDSASTVQNWFIGFNPYLDEQSPANLIRDSISEEIEKSLLIAANQFAATAPPKENNNV